MASSRSDIVIRPYRSTDPIGPITTLLHRAYSSLAAMGFRYVATTQSDEVTESRLSRGESFLALLGDRIVGTITLYATSTYDETCEVYRDPGTGYFGQFGVEPDLQGQKVGSRLLRKVEERAVELGLRRIALDTAEGATHLIEWYEREGYAIVDEVDWSMTNYRSVIMVKDLGQSDG